MTPVAKMYTAKKAVENASEGLECFGGQGYIEDTGLPMMLRDAQVLPIWEGTSNVMALDVMRAMAKTKGQAFSAFNKRVWSIVDDVTKNSNDDNIKSATEALKSALRGLIDFMKNNQSEAAIMEVAGRDFAFTLAHIYIGALLLEQAQGSGDKMDAVTALQWTMTRDMSPVVTRSKLKMYRMMRTPETMRDFVFENYDPQECILPR